MCRTKFPLRPGPGGQTGILNLKGFQFFTDLSEKKSNKSEAYQVSAQNVVSTPLPKFWKMCFVPKSHANPNVILL